MKLTHIDLYSGEDEIGSFALRDSSLQNRYILRNATGLDADEIVSKYYGSGLVSKAKFFNLSLRPRDIVLSIVLNPQYTFNESFSELRDELYRTIASSRTGLVTLYFKYAGTTAATISGHVTKFESSYFTGNPEVTITIRCDDPVFRAPNPVRINVNATLTNPMVVVADSRSSAPHGFGIQVTFTAAASAFEIQDKATSPDWVFSVAPSGGFLVGDEFYMSNESTKQLYIQRGATKINLMDKVAVGSVWPILFPGSNTLYYVRNTSILWHQLEFYPSHWGV